MAAFTRGRETRALLHARPVWNVRRGVATPAVHLPVLTCHSSPATSRPRQVPLCQQVATSIAPASHKRLSRECPEPLTPLTRPSSLNSAPARACAVNTCVQPMKGMSIHLFIDLNKKILVCGYVFPGVLKNTGIFFSLC